jgi:hypothetical protein
LVPELIIFLNFAEFRSDLFANSPTDVAHQLIRVYAEYFEGREARFRTDESFTSTKDRVGPASTVWVLV